MVTGNEDAGGLVGDNGSEGEITTSYATGNVTSDGFGAGGLVGTNSSGSSSGNVLQSYAMGDVVGDAHVGGLVGFNGDGTVSETYATGGVTAGDFVGGLIGDNIDGSITASYWDTASSGLDESAGGEGLATSEMQGPEAESNMDGFDFENVWNTTPAYPEFD